MDLEELFQEKISLIEQNQAKFENKFAGGRKLNDIIKELEIGEGLSTIWSKSGLLKRKKIRKISI